MLFKKPRLSKFLITLHFRSGLQLQAYCVTLNVKWDQTDDHLTSMQWTGGQNWPLHFNMHEVIVIESRTVSRWRGGWC